MYGLLLILAPYNTLGAIYYLASGSPLSPFTRSLYWLHTVFLITSAASRYLVIPLTYSIFHANTYTISYLCWLLYLAPTYYDRFDKGTIRSLMCDGEDIIPLHTQCYLHLALRSRRSLVTVPYNSPCSITWSCHLA